MEPVTLTPAQREQLRQQRVMKAYRDLFGAEDKLRSEIQRTVWEDLRIAGYADKPEWVPDKDGKVCPHRAALAGGRRSLFLYIESNVKFSPVLE